MRDEAWTSPATEGSCVCVQNAQATSDGNCACPDAMYFDEATRSCLDFTSCSESCGDNNCYNHPDTCILPCPSGLNFNYEETVEINGNQREIGTCTCSDPQATYANQECTCPDGFAPFDGNVCEPCDQSCLGCTGPQPTDCVACANANAVVDAGQCYCHEGFFAEGAECTLCDANCQTCSGPQDNECTTCAANKVLQNGSCVCTTNSYYDLSSLTCIGCDIGCLTCTGGSDQDCLSCADPNAQVVASPGACECISGFVSLGGPDCVQCDMTCASCTGNQPEQCTSCVDGRVLNVDNNQNEGFCECVVNSTVQSDGQCVCNAGLYFDAATRQCLDGNPTCAANQYLDPGCNCCYDCHSTCQTCNFDSSYDCTACVDPNAETSGFPGPCDCMAGFYDRDDTEVIDCVQCNEHCITCSGDSEQSCLSCADNAFLTPLDPVNSDSGHCTCNDGFFPLFNPNFFCEVCDLSCRTCDDTSPQNCLSCSDPNMTVNSAGECACNDHFYKVETSGVNTCVACLAECGTCVDGSTCTTCLQPNQVLDSNGACVCGDGSYFEASLNTCSPCNNLCATCTAGSENDCVECKQDAQGFGCVIACDSFDVNADCVCVDGYYYDVQVLQLPVCSPCAVSCATCDYTGQGCTSCLDANAEGTLCQCSAGYYYDTTTRLCHLECDDGSARADVDSQCEPCYGDCATCVGLNDYQCTSCEGLSTDNFGKEASGTCDCIPNATANSDGNCECDAGFTYDAATHACTGGLICADQCATCHEIPENCVYPCPSGLSFNFIATQFIAGQQQEIGDCLCLDISMVYNVAT